MAEKKGQGLAPALDAYHMTIQWTVTNMRGELFSYARGPNHLPNDRGLAPKGGGG
jgi:hypothetical protein